MDVVYLKAASCPSNHLASILLLLSNYVNCAIILLNVLRSPIIPFDIQAYDEREPANAGSLSLGVLFYVQE